MQANNQVTYNARTYLTPKLTTHNKLRKLISLFYQIYCFFAGPLHVLPDFYIVGGQKCGTTSMYVYLTQHPSVKSPVAKDIRFFDKYFFKGINWYRVNFPLKIQKLQFKKQQSKFISGEGTERYLDHPFAPERIKKVTPNAKFIVLLRNPVDRAYSHYKMISRRHSESLSFEEAIKQEKTRTQGPYKKMLNDPNYYSDIYFRHGYLHRGIYVDKLKHWMNVFPKEQFLIIQSEEFLQNPSKIYNEVLEFLELPKYTLSNYKQYRKQDYSESNLDPELRKQLIEYFKPHNQRLYEFLGRKFDWDK